MSSVLGGCCLVGSSAFAQPPKGEPSSDGLEVAAGLFERGREAFEQERYREAAQLFEAAHAKAPAAAALYNAGQAWAAAGEEARAADRLLRALALGALSAPDEASARRKLGELEPRLAKLRFEGPTGLRVTVDHLEAVEVPVASYLPPGEHVATIENAQGDSISQTIVVEAGENVRLQLLRPSPEPAQAAPSAPPEPPPGERASSTPWPIVGWTATAVGAAGLVTAAILGPMALDARDDFEASSFTDASARSRATDLRTGTNVAWIAGALVGAFGITVLVVDASTERAALVLAPDQASLRLAF